MSNLEAKKKARLENNFKVVLQRPEEILELRRKHSDARRNMYEETESAFNKFTAQMEDVQRKYEYGINSISRMTQSIIKKTKEITTSVEKIKDDVESCINDVKSASEDLEERIEQSKEGLFEDLKNEMKNCKDICASIEKLETKGAVKVLCKTVKSKYI